MTGNVRLAIIAQVLDGIFGILAPNPKPSFAAFVKESVCVCVCVWLKSVVHSHS